MNLYFKKIALVLSITLTLGLAPLVGPTPHASADSMPTCDASALSVQVCVSTVSEGTYLERVPVDQTNNYVLSGDATVQIDVYYPIVGVPPTLTLFDGTSEIELEPTVEGSYHHYSFTNISINDSTPYVFLKVGLLGPDEEFVEHDIRFIGKIGSSKGILKVQLTNPEYSPNSLLIDKKSFNINGTPIIPIVTPYTNFQFFVVPTNIHIGSFKVNKLEYYWETESYIEHERYFKTVRIPSTSIQLNKVNTLNFYSSRNVNLQLSSSNTSLNLSNQKIMACSLDNPWYFEFDSCEWFAFTTDLSGQISISELPAGSWWFYSVPDYQPSESPYTFNPDMSLGFGIKVESEIKMYQETQTIPIPVYEKATDRKYNISDVVNLARQATPSGNDADPESGAYEYTDRYFLENFILYELIRSRVVEEYPYYDQLVQ
jgi:hypothetical protein